jgi:hypothetical protein
VIRRGAVLLEVLDAETTSRPDPGPAVEEELDDRSVAVVEHRVARGEPHELACAGRREGLGLVAGVGRAPGDELGVGRIWDRDGQPELGRDALEALDANSNRASKDATMHRAKDLDASACYLGCE